MSTCFPSWFKAITFGPRGAPCAQTYPSHINPPFLSDSCSLRYFLHHLFECSSVFTLTFCFGRVAQVQEPLHSRSWYHRVYIRNSWCAAGNGNTQCLPTRTASSLGRIHEQILRRRWAQIPSILIYSNWWRRRVIDSMFMALNVLARVFIVLNDHSPFFHWNIPMQKLNKKSLPNHCVPESIPDQVLFSWLELLLCVWYVRMCNFSCSNNKSMKGALLLNSNTSDLQCFCQSYKGVILAFIRFVIISCKQNKLWGAKCKYQARKLRELQRSKMASYSTQHQNPPQLAKLKLSKTSRLCWR